jgi:hypothetical protein
MLPLILLAKIVRVRCEAMARAAASLKRIKA